MANFAGRRATNVSQYLQDLNVIPSEHEQQQHEASYNLSDDLSLFANTEVCASQVPILQSALCAARDP